MMVKEDLELSISKLMEQLEYHCLNQQALKS